MVLGMPDPPPIVDAENGNPICLDSLIAHRSNEGGLDRTMDFPAAHSSKVLSPAEFIFHCMASRARAYSSDASVRKNS